MKDITFDGKVAIVTGAGTGIGREYALELAKRGAKVVVNDLGGTVNGDGSSSAVADEVVLKIRQAGGDAVANGDNVATVEGGENIVKTAVETYGTVDILINNAGIIRDKSFEKMTENEWDAVVAVHLKGAFCVTQPALKVMKQNNYGRVIFTTSTSGLFGNFGQSNYGAAKLGLVGLMNTLKLELKKYDIAINCIAPTAWSRMTENLMPEELGKKMKSQFNVPLTLYLCTDESRVTGNTYVMGAGWFGRAAIVCAEGACLGDTKRDISLEEIREHFDTIDSLEKTRPLDSGLEAFSFMQPLLG